MRRRKKIGNSNFYHFAVIVLFLAILSACNRIQDNGKGERVVYVDHIKGRLNIDFLKGKCTDYLAQKRVTSSNPLGYILLAAVQDTNTIFIGLDLNHLMILNREYTIIDTFSCKDILFPIYLKDNVLFKEDTVFTEAIRKKYSTFKGYLYKETKPWKIQLNLNGEVKSIDTTYVTPTVRSL